MRYQAYSIRILNNAILYHRKMHWQDENLQDMHLIYCKIKICHIIKTSKKGKKEEKVDDKLTFGISIVRHDRFNKTAFMIFDYY